MKNYRKIFFNIILSVFLFFVSSASADENCSKMSEGECSAIQGQKEIQNSAKNDLSGKNCEKCVVEDDEYCTYNQCYFDKQYRMLKSKLMPDKNQENCMDNIYLNFKQDLEILCERYSKEKNELLELVAADTKYLRRQKEAVKNVKSDIKEKYKDYLGDTQEILSKKQKKEFAKFKRCQSRKIRLIKKYGAVYKFPCS